MSKMLRTVRLEFMKWKRSRILVSALAATIIGPFVAVLSTYSKLNSPHAADAGWHSFFGVAWQVNISLIYPIIFGALAAYVFVQEYTDRTIVSLLTLPVSRTRIALTKLITIYLTLVLLIATSTALSFLLGLLIVPEPLTLPVVLRFSRISLAAGVMALALVPVFAYIGIRTRHFIPPLVGATGFTFLNFATLVSEQYGPYVPTAIPVFYVLRAVGWFTAPLPYTWELLIPAFLISLYLTLRLYNTSDVH